MTLLAVDPGGRISPAELQRYGTVRSERIAKAMSTLSGNEKVKSWQDDFSEECLYRDSKYLGDASGESEAVASLRKAKATDNPMEEVIAIEDFIRFFCGFHSIKAKFLANAVHFQFEVDQDTLRSMELPQVNENEKVTDAVKSIFDASQVVSGELLLRAVVETDDGSLIANPMSPGRAMGLLQKLPLYAQFVMVLTNAIEAVWYENALNCKMSLNVYASLLAHEAPVLEMIDGVSSVEVMEMTKGVERAGVMEWVTQIRDRGIEVLLDDFDSKHPGAGSDCDGVKVCVFANAFHTLQAFNEGGAQTVGDVKKEQLNDMDFRDYHCSLVPTVQPRIKKIVFEGSENCMKSIVSPGPPLNFSIAQATTASAHVYQTAARIQSVQNPGLQMVHQGGRALYDDEVFDDNMLALLRNLGKDPAGSARAGDAGTLSWMGEEAKRRAEMKTRPLVCGLAQTNLASHTDSVESAETANVAKECDSLLNVRSEKHRSPAVERLMKLEIRGWPWSSGRWFGLFPLFLSWHPCRCFARRLVSRMPDRKMVVVCLAVIAMVARRQASVAHDGLLGERTIRAVTIRQE